MKSYKITLSENYNKALSVYQKYRIQGIDVFTGSLPEVKMLDNSGDIYILKFDQKTEGVQALSIFSQGILIYREYLSLSKMNVWVPITLEVTGNSLYLLDRYKNLLEENKVEVLKYRERNKEKYLLVKEGIDFYDVSCENIINLLYGDYFISPIGCTKNTILYLPNGRHSKNFMSKYGNYLEIKNFHDYFYHELYSIDGFKKACIKRFERYYTRTNKEKEVLGLLLMEGRDV